MYNIDLQYFGNINYIKNIVYKSNIEIHLYERCKKMSFANKTVIATANGTQLLTVPLRGGRDSKRLWKDTLISYHFDWQKYHLKALKTAYNRSPYFEHYYDDLSKIIERRFDYLFDLNLCTLGWIKKVLGIHCDIVIKHEVLDIPNNEPVCFIPFEDGGYNGEGKATNQVHFNLEQTTKFKPYWQVFKDRNGFIPNMSILDLLFNEGTHSSSFL
ncbi:MAG: WbqC family protein [Phycisphaerales bacterium]|nr:WbqC family protein [Phycisphaerales bacterium]